MKNRRTQALAPNLGTVSGAKTKGMHDHSSTATDSRWLRADRWDRQTLVFIRIVAFIIIGGSNKPRPRYWRPCTRPLWPSIIQFLPKTLNGVLVVGPRRRLLASLARGIMGVSVPQAEPQVRKPARHTTPAPPPPSPGPGCRRHGKPRQLPQGEPQTPARYPGTFPQEIRLQTRWKASSPNPDGGRAERQK